MNWQTFHILHSQHVWFLKDKGCFFLEDYHFKRFRWQLQRQSKIKIKIYKIESLLICLWAGTRHQSGSETRRLMHLSSLALSQGRTLTETSKKASSGEVLMIKMTASIKWSGWWIYLDPARFEWFPFWIYYSGISVFWCRSSRKVLFL